MIKNPVKRRFAVCASGILTTVLSLFILANAQENNSLVTIYHTNDIHGNVNSVVKDGVTTQIGLDLIKSVKSSSPNSILIDAGDALQGTALGKHRKGKDIVEIMNAVGYDGMTLGNHEFDYGSDAVKECAESANFPIVSANVLKNGGVFLKGVNGNNGCNFIKEINGKRIGFFGITTEETNRTTIPPNLEGITFLDEIETSKNEVKKLKAQKADIIIGIMHVGVDVSSKITSHEIAKKVPGVDIIIDGHSHTRTTDTIGNTVVTQTGTGAVSLGKIDIKFNGNKFDVKAVTIPAQDIGNMFNPDVDITRLYEDRYAEIKPIQEKVVGRTENNLYGGTYAGKNICRFTETNLGDLICDSMIYNSKSLLKGTEFAELPVVAFENGGAVRDKIDSGYITMANIVDVLPLDNKMSVQIITPAQLYQVLERGVGKISSSKEPGQHFTGPFGGFPQIAGMKVEIDPSQKPHDYSSNSGGNRVKSVTITNWNGGEGKSLNRDDQNTKIVFLCNDYTIYEFPSIKDQNIEIHGDYLSDILAEYIQKLTFDGNGKFSYPLSGQRVIINKDKDIFSAFNSVLTIKDDSGVLSGAEVQVYTDGQNSGMFTTNEYGQFTLEKLASGNHDVSIEYKDLKDSAYVNDEMGLYNTTIFITDKSYDNIINVSNIIGQIPYIITSDAEDIIKFARVSYDELSEQNKSKIINYTKLESAEEKFSQIGNPSNIYEAAPPDQYKTTIIVVIFFILLSGTAIIWLIVKNRKSKTDNKNINAV